MANGTGSTTWTSPSGVRRGDKASTECSSHTIALPVEDLHDSVRVSIARHRVTDTAGICHGPGEASAVSSQSLTRALSPSAPYRRPGYGQGNRPGQQARDVTGATRPPGARS